MRTATATTPASAGAQAPSFTPAPDWPKPLPQGWSLGPVNGIAVDARGHIWINHFVGTPPPGTVMERLMTGAGGDDLPPPIVELDETGAFVQAWGGAGEGYDWPKLPHGLFVDHKGYVWIGGTWKGEDAQILKFTRDGKFIMQIGRPGPPGGADRTDRLGRPANFFVDPKTNEVYVADGYGNRRIVVFDADTGKFKRFWGAYGKPPADPRPDALDNFYNSDPFDPRAPPPEHFNSPVHCVVMAADGLVYVVDRTNGRVQVFCRDGRFVREFLFNGGEPGSGGQITDLALWPDRRQTFLIAGFDDIRVLRRSDGQVLTRSGGGGEFRFLHVLAIDRKGNVYTGDVDKQVLKWTPSRSPTASGN